MSKIPLSTELYWASPDKLFSAENKLPPSFVTLEDNINLCFSFVIHAEVTGIRLDPTHKKEAFIITDAAVLDSNNKKVWSFDCNRLKDELVNAKVVELLDGHACLCESTSADPQWLPIIDADILNEVSPNFVFYISIITDQQAILDLCLEKEPANFTSNKAHAFTLNARSNIKTKSVISSLKTTMDTPYKPAYEDNIDFSDFKTDIKAITFYLPQFHECEENNEWWGDGFTEWSNTKKAKPRFENHYQPREPHDDIGYYDLLDVKTLQKQAKLARSHGIYGFCFYYYWFSGKRLLEKPLDLLLAHPEIDINFCLCWANENWTRTWDGLDKNILIEQQYLADDPINFIKDLERYIDDARYIKVDGKPVIIVYKPQAIPNVAEVFSIWRKWWKDHHTSELEIWCIRTMENAEETLATSNIADAFVEFPPHINPISINQANLGLETSGSFYDYQATVNDILQRKISNVTPGKNLYRSVMLEWDNSARKENGWATWYDFSTKAYYIWLRHIINLTKVTHSTDKQFVFINAWNEWAEGTYLEPDKKFGYSNINTTSRALFDLPYSKNKKQLAPLISQKNMKKNIKKKSIGIHVHITFNESAHDILRYINNIPYEFDLFITTNAEDKSKELQALFDKFGAQTKLHTSFVPNIGHAIGALLVALNEKLSKYDYIGHFQADSFKKLDWSYFQEKELLNSLLGSSEKIESILSELEGNEKKAIFSPPVYGFDNAYANWNDSRLNQEDLIRMLGGGLIGSEQYRFPKSNMFWAKTTAIQPLLKHQWSYDNFEPNEGLESVLASKIDMLQAEKNQLLQSSTQLSNEATALQQAVHDRDSQLQNHQNNIASILGSTSWKITKPMRTAVTKARNIKNIAKLAPNILNHGGGIVPTLNKVKRIYAKEGLQGIKSRINDIDYRRHHSVLDYVEWIKRYDTLTSECRKKMASKADAFQLKPTISIIMPTYNANQEWLIEAIESVRKQIYTNWELCIADDASTDPKVTSTLKKYARLDKRIKVVFRNENGHISEASNSALEISSGSWVALLDHDDVLTEHALYWLADSINNHQNAGLIYSDEDKLNEKGQRTSPYFKCDFNYDLFLSQNMITHLGCYRADLVKKVGGFRTEFNGSQDYDLALRVIEQLEHEQIIHIPRILYHWRIHKQSTANDGDQKPYAHLAAMEAIREHLSRIGVAGNVVPAPGASGMNRVAYDLPRKAPSVDIIIPTRDMLDLLRKCIDSITSLTTYTNYSITIINNGSVEPATLSQFEKWSKNGQDGIKIKIINDDSPFNYSALNNKAVEQSHAKHVCLMNNDIEVISTDWLTEMVMHTIRPEIGCVGAKLYYSDDTLQHAGVIIGLGGVAGHSHKYFPKGSAGYFFRLQLLQNLSAVTAACLLVRREVFKQVAGLNEENLKIAFNDVDFCLKVQAAGYRNLWTPYAELYHHESVSRGHEDTPEKQARFSSEVSYMKEKWGDLLTQDKYYSPNLTLDREDFSMAWPPSIKSEDC